jgi:hypothetical protein
MLVVRRKPPFVPFARRSKNLGYRAHSMPGAQRTAIGITGNQGEGRARHSRRDARRAGSHPCHQALQAGQPRRERRRHGHHAFPRHRRHHRRQAPRHHGRTLLHRKPRAGFFAVAESVANAPEPSSFAEEPTSRALRPTLFRDWAKKACASWPKSASSSACASLPKPSTTNRSTWSRNMPT